MTLESLNRDALTRICDGDQRAIRFFETLTDLVSQMSGGQQLVPAPSGSTVSLTGIPSWVSEIAILFDGVTLSGTANLLVQLGTDAGVEVTGYNSTSAFIDGAAVGAANSDAGFVAWVGAGSLPVRGVMVLRRYSPDEDAWIATHSVRKSTTQAANGAGGAKVLSGALSSITIGQTGAATFTGGRVSVGYRR